jgi:hypothetical protein
MIGTRQRWVDNAEVGLKGVQRNVVDGFFWQGIGTGGVLL